MKVVAHPLVVAGALGLLGPLALESDEREVAEPTPCVDCPDRVARASSDVAFAVDAADELSLPETVYLTLG